MKRSVLAVLVLTVTICGLVIPSALKAESDEYKVPMNDEGTEAVMVETRSGNKAIVYILNETPDVLYVQNLSDSMEVTIPRANVTNIRKPTAKELEKARQNTTPVRQ
ncbi:MAG: hypothetical protein JXB40_01155 [Candidatus Omnitrophica bacterium]|nr:hypothetical protein [Candidatus Omnitrophota bacterium]